MFQVENSHPESVAVNRAAVLLHLQTDLLLIDVAAENMLLDFLLLLQDVNFLTGTPGSVFL